jgi:beta-galactosidase/beta-glucuronidase
VSRITRLIQRDRNHPSVIMWSLGNEAGRGRNLWKARQLVKHLDRSRPCVYESGGLFAEGAAGGGYYILFSDKANIFFSFSFFCALQNEWQELDERN